MDGNISDILSMSCSTSSLDHSVQFSSSILSSFCENDNESEKSWFSQASELSIAQPNIIPVMVGYRPVRTNIVREPTVRRVLRRENKCVQLAYNSVL